MFGQNLQLTLNEQQLYKEILYYRILLLIVPKMSNPEGLLSFIVQNGVEGFFSNLCIFIQIMPAISISTASVRDNSGIKNLLVPT